MSENKESQEKERSLREIAEMFNKRMTQQDVEGERNFINGILDEVSDPNVKIPEPVFREIFLPYFTGQKEMSTKESAVMHWMGLVGGASVEADVVDVSGNVLFKVPPVCDTSILNVVRGDEYSPGFASIFSVFEDQSRVHYALGNQHLAENLAEKTVQIVKQKPISNGWDGVMSYYKLGDKAPDAIEKKKNEMPGDDGLVLDDD